ncbi:MAG: YbaB/EbfC family nucleoid-associated protein, partial [Clostridia bacterium]|nr:YbaB/EbfC family nucleoid-associated protein [Clostridia bacterium]
VYMNAKKIIDGIEIDKSVIAPDDEEMLEDLITAAILDGYKKADEVYNEKMSKFGGMGGGLGGGLF